jgi:hypothetical protein
MTDLRLLFCTRMNSQSTIARTPVLRNETVSRRRSERTKVPPSPFQRRQAHNVQTGNTLPPLLIIQLATLSPPRALDLMLVPLLIVVSDLRDGERVGTILLVREQEQWHAENLGRRQDRVCAPRIPWLAVECRRTNGRCVTEDFPAFAEPLVVDRIDHVDDGVAVAVVLGPYGADTALATEIPELEHCRGQRDLPGCACVQKIHIQYFCTI